MGFSIGKKPAPKEEKKPKTTQKLPKVTTPKRKGKIRTDPSKR